MKKFDRSSEISNWYLSRRARGTAPNSLDLAVKNAILGFDSDDNLRVYGELGEKFEVFVHQRYVYVREYKAHPSGGREIVAITRVARRSKAADRFAKAERKRAQSWAGQRKGWYAPHAGASS